MKTVLAFGIILAITNAKGILTRNSGDDARGSYGEIGFGQGNEYEHGKRKSEESFHTYLDQNGNVISKANGKAILRSERHYPKIANNGRIVYTKSNYGSYGGYDSSTVTYGYNENSGNYGGGFDGSGGLDVRFGVGTERPTNFEGYNSNRLNRGNIINTGQVGYRNINNEINGFRRTNNYDRFGHLRGFGGFGGFGGIGGFGGFGGLGFGLSGLPFGGPNGLGHFNNWGSGFQGLKSPSVPISGIPAKPNSGLINQKFDEINGGLDGVDQDGDGDGSVTTIGSNECGSSTCAPKGKYAYASASASAGSYRK
ncbi:PE-PGRS family protein PE_PGRS47-like [Bicyclus anynana]|uniref:PE-PGRS family protein PE_PGRS47-like n=1 Tax=Bicyclus anynana TaxID=110368 RepID=A0ABM3LF12_BICAN|nr:PE-PGRS family protein PE_PGRS47-like [Bicyclus anynana]